MRCQFLPSGCDAGCFDSCYDDCNAKFQPYNYTINSVCLFYCQTGRRPGKLTEVDYIKLVGRYTLKPQPGKDCDDYCEKNCKHFSSYYVDTKATYQCEPICKAGCPGSSNGGITNGTNPDDDMKRAEKLFTGKLVIASICP